MASIPTNANKLVSTRDNNFFTNNKIVIVEDVPTEGYYNTGDIAINMYPSDYVGWICVEEGEPGQWDVMRSITDDYRIQWSKVYQKPTTFPPTIGIGATDAFAGDKGNVAYAHATSTHAPTNAQKNSDITKAEIEAKLTGNITSHTHNYAGASTAGGAATSAAKTTGTLTIQGNGTSLNTFNGSSNKTINITPANIGAATSGHTHDGYASAYHTHGLLNSDFTKEITGSDGGWELINNTNLGYLLVSLRGGNSVPSWFNSAYSAGVIFGGSDTKGVVSMSYSAPSITFAGGASSPNWNMKVTGSSNTTYNLNNFVTSSYVDTKIGDINTILSSIVGA